MYENIVQLKLASTSDKKQYVTDTANTTTLLRIIQTIPSPKAEPLKRWLAEVGSQRLEEVQNPEAAIEQMRQTLEERGYPEVGPLKAGVARILLKQAVRLPSLTLGRSGERCQERLKSLRPPRPQRHSSQPLSSTYN